MQKKLFARQAEVFAGYAAYTDYEIGRVIQAVQDMGKLDNTLIIYIVGDNGTSPEGSCRWHAQPADRLQRDLQPARGVQLLHYRRLGLATRPTRTCRSAWTWAFDTPVQVDQAGGVALRRHAAGDGDLVAGSHHG